MEDTMTNRRWNQFIDFANANRPVTELVPPIQNEQERRFFEDMTSRLAEMRKTVPGSFLQQCRYGMGRYRRPRRLLRLIF